MALDETLPNLYNGFTAHASTMRTLYYLKSSEWLKTLCLICTVYEGGRHQRLCLENGFGRAEIKRNWMTVRQWSIYDSSGMDVPPVSL